MRHRQTKQTAAMLATGDEELRARLEGWRVAQTEKVLATPDPAAAARDGGSR